MGGTLCLPVTHIMNYWWESEGTVTERRDLQRYERTPRALLPTPFLASTSAFCLSSRPHTQLLFSFSFLRTPFHSSPMSCVLLHCMDHISAKLDFSCCSKIRNLPHPDQHINVLWCLEQDRLWGRGPKRIQRKDLTVLCHSWGWWIIKLEQICHH